MERHFTATTLIVCENKVLLHFHKKLNKWLPVGGHIKENELPDAAAIREVEEETGLDATLYDPNHKKVMRSDEARTMIQPMHLLLENVDVDHQHMDFNYYATSKSFDLSPQEGETTELRWFTAEELEKEKLPLLVKKMALEALKILGTN